MHFLPHWRVLPCNKNKSLTARWKPLHAKTGMEVKTITSKYPPPFYDSWIKLFFSGVGVDFDY